MLPVLTYTAPEAAADALRWRHATLDLAERARPRARPARARRSRGGRSAARSARATGRPGTAALPRQRRHRRRRPPLPRGDRRRRLRARARASSCSSRRRGCGARSATTTRRAASASTASPGPDEYTRDRRQQRLHEPDGAAEPARRRGGRGPPSRSAPPTLGVDDGGDRPPGATRPTAIVVPYDERLGVHPQAEGFTRHARLGLRRARAPDEYPLLLHFPYFDLYRKQVVKQADLVLALYAVRRRVHAPRRRRATSPTTRRSPCATRRCRRACRRSSPPRSGTSSSPTTTSARRRFVDLRDLDHNTRDGLHIASLAGAWLAAVCGLRRHARPRRATCPSRRGCRRRLERLAFRLLFRGRRLRVDVRPRRGALRARRRRAARGAPPRRGGRPGAGPDAGAARSRPSTRGRRRASRRGASPGGGTSRRD